MRYKTYLLDGYSFIFPYLIIYAVAFTFNLQTAYLRYLFLGLTAFNITYFFTLYVKKEIVIPHQEVIFWLILTTYFLLSTSMMEHSSDKWEHFRRINLWDHLAHVDESPLKNKMAYSIANQFSFFIPAEYKLTFCRFYSCAWQSLLAFQIIRLCKGAFKLNDFEAKCALVITVATLGNSCFSFFNYYSLSSTVPAYIFYLAFLNDILQGKKKSLSYLIAPIFCYYNHTQELMFCVIVSSFVFTVYMSRNLEIKYKIILTIIIIAGLQTSFREFNLQQYVHYSESAYLTPGGRAKLTNGPAFWQSSGVFYYLTMSIAIITMIFQKKNRLLLSLIFIAPFLLASPLFNLLFLKTSQAPVLYRVFYLVPLGPVLVLSLKYFNIKRGKLLIICCCLAITPINSPMNGKLLFITNPSKPIIDSDLIALTRKHQKILSTYHTSRTFESFSGLYTKPTNEKAYNGKYTLIHYPKTEEKLSYVGFISKHWNKNIIQKEKLAFKNITRTKEQFQNCGYKKLRLDNQIDIYEYDLPVKINVIGKNLNDTSISTQENKLVATLGSANWLELKINRPISKNASISFPDGSLTKIRCIAKDNSGKTIIKSIQAEPETNLYYLNSLTEPFNSLDLHLYSVQIQSDFYINLNQPYILHNAP